MDQLQQKIEKRIKENTDKIANESSRPVDLHLSANFSSNDEKSQIIQIETTSPLDPDIHFRVQRHTNRIHLVENDIEDVLSTNLPTYMPQKVIRQLNEQAQNNQNLIDELQKKFEDFESDLRDIKSEKLEKEEQKKKLKDNSIVPGAITHAEFTTYQEHIFNKFSEISHNISLSVLDTEKSLVDLNDQLQLIEGKINNYNESALGFGALIKMTSKQVFNAEQKLKEKSRFQLTTTQNSGMKLKQIEEQGKIKVDEMSFKVKEEINSLKKKIARISADLKNEMKEPPVNPPND
ncbi:hypothetical protein TRFO_18532 [Tritrichomonas foetus]|uniref:Uncharacterized protein n=1 Tax=Tritrichomonas foetus TaxID=1144522 RepID=A0A1J4KPY5_9EUKA|nr:hypothetical protein TRFO_18532 [Tritrichomonas foetus]|eukprot:OHT11852.1 hypothetical protein TRFO_18532 [Tritrichomonas foetus]